MPMQKPMRVRNNVQMQQVANQKRNELMFWSDSEQAIALN